MLLNLRASDTLRCSLSSCHAPFLFTLSSLLFPLYSFLLLFPLYSLLLLFAARQQCSPLHAFLLPRPFTLTLSSFTLSSLLFTPHLRNVRGLALSRVAAIIIPVRLLLYIDIPAGLASDLPLAQRSGRPLHSFTSASYPRCQTLLLAYFLP